MEDSDIVDNDNRINLNKFYLIRLQKMTGCTMSQEMYYLQVSNNNLAF